MSLSKKSKRAPQRLSESDLSSLKNENKYGKSGSNKLDSERWAQPAPYPPQQQRKPKTRNLSPTIESLNGSRDSKKIRSKSKNNNNTTKKKKSSSSPLLDRKAIYETRGNNTTNSKTTKATQPKPPKVSSNKKKGKKSNRRRHSVDTSSLGSSSQSDHGIQSPQPNNSSKAIVRANRNRPKSMDSLKIEIHLPKNQPTSTSSPSHQDKAGREDDSSSRSRRRRNKKERKSSKDYSSRSHSRSRNRSKSLDRSNSREDRRSNRNQSRQRSKSLESHRSRKDAEADKKSTIRKRSKSEDRHRRQRSYSLEKTRPESPDETTTPPPSKNYYNNKSQKLQQQRKNNDKSITITKKSNQKSKQPNKDKKLYPKDENNQTIFKKQQQNQSFDRRKLITSKKEIDVVTMNNNGQGILGMTPGYKIKMIKEYLNTFPDVIFIQDSIELEDMMKLIDEVSNEKYEYVFQDILSSTDENANEDLNATISTLLLNKKSVTGIVWNRDKYSGVPLDVETPEMSNHRKWIKDHNLTIVLLKSITVTLSGLRKEDVYPSFIAVSWHGPHYDIPLRIRMQVMKEFFGFLKILRSNNGYIPVLIGGDFNLDIKSHIDIQSDEIRGEYLYVPYRPVSGNLAKDLRNTFMFSLDTLQVTETGFKQYHPEIFACPFISIKIRGRTKIKIWAVTRIQRYWRRYLERKKSIKENKKKTKETKKRWKKKINGSATDSSSDSEDDSDSRPKSAQTLTSNKSAGTSSTRRSSLSVMDDIYKRTSTKDAKYSDNGFPIPVPTGGIASFRRRRFDDLKSIQQRKAEMAKNEILMRHYDDDD